MKLTLGESREQSRRDSQWLNWRNRWKGIVESNRCYGEKWKQQEGKELRIAVQSNLDRGRFEGIFEQRFKEREGANPQDMGWGWGGENVPGRKPWGRNTWCAWGITRPAGLSRISKMRMDKVKEVVEVRTETDPYGSSEPERGLLLSLSERSGATGKLWITKW